MQIGDKKSWERTFTLEDVRNFSHLSGDQGAHHLLPDNRGRIMVHGLLTATLPTKLGGEMNYIARTMNFEFLRPVYVGDTIRCEVTITNLSCTAGRLLMDSSVTCINQNGKPVLIGKTQGIVREEAPRTQTPDVSDLIPGD
ncbi:hotdog domain-containing protein [Ktedonospora formicarum]|uniref:Enoyl-CoA hydratase n=1 Tax=Ktedonospora formicarum TaxID=2778364 RepID=A0A8J3I1K6_9CHLR|nr:hotdog domain-containing protein [Ktedonospora formicarum]GHO43834.1 enoyl-CoA hydratase [Ktedonospora formicarum]